MKIIMIDNYDSFTYNLYQLFTQFLVEMPVFRNDSIEVEEIRTLNPNGIIISPGPKDPSETGICKDLVWCFKDDVPILGVCLGMQIINEVFGGRTVLAPRPVHGETDLIFHRGKGVFASLPSPFKAARYHSLMVEVLNSDLEITARNSENIPMGIRHRKHRIFGVQFHPESFMTDHGHIMAENFIRMVQEHEKNKY